MFENITTKTTENSEVEISASLSADAVAKYRSKAVKSLSESINLPGFRPGKIPESVLVAKVGEHAVLEESAELAIREGAPELIEKYAPNYIGRPHIAITKLASGNPVEFKITIAVMPTVELPDYKKIAATEMAKPAENLEITDKEVNDVIEEVRKQRAHMEYHKIHHDEKGHEHNPDELETLKPEVNDEFVKSLGDFKDVADFKEKAKANLRQEKERRSREKKRGELLEKLVSETTLKLPQVLVEGELSRMFAQFESDVKGVGLKIEDYLKHINKTPEDMRKEWLPDAEKRAKLNIILEAIAKKEKIEADKATVDTEVEHLTSHYKDIDPIRARLYAEHMLTIEKVIQFLEGVTK